MTIRTFQENFCHLNDVSECEWNKWMLWRSFFIKISFQCKKRHREMKSFPIWYRRKLLTVKVYVWSTSIWINLCYQNRDHRSFSIFSWSESLGMWLSNNFRFLSEKYISMSSKVRLSVSGREKKNLIIHCNCTLPKTTMDA